MLFRSEVVPKLPVLLLESREHVLLLSMGPYRTFRTVYSIAPAVTKKDTISCAVKLSLKMRTFKCGSLGGLLQCGSGWGMGGAGEWRSLEMAELGDVWSAQEGFFFFLSLFFYSNGIFFTFEFYTVVCSDNAERKIFASYLTIASRACFHPRAY